jgi:ElaB/YqjD/DUF883 family membrane-anchored ribosome-binding protein
MSESSNTSNPAAEKLGSSQAHAKKALETTATVAREVAEVAKSGARTAYTAGREELGAAAQDLKEAARHTYEDLSREAKTRYSEVIDRSSEVAAEYRVQLEDLADQAEDYIRDNPFRAIGITFAAGVFLGLLLRRR